MKSAISFGRLLGALILAGFTTAVAAVGPTHTITITPSSPNYDATAGQITFTVTMAYTEASLSGMGIQLVAPTGWKFVSSAGTNVPNTNPALNQIGNLPFAYFSVPASPVSFTFTVSYPAGLTGNQVFTGIQANFTDEAANAVFETPSNITISPAPTPIAITTSPANQTVTQGQTATFTVVATGSAPTYVWKRGAATLTDTGNISGSTTATLTVANAQPADEGSYTVVVSNTIPSSLTSTAATLTVNTPATIATQPTDQATTVGVPATFAVVAAGKPTTFTYQWKKGTTDISGATNASYTIASPQLADTGSTYSVTVSNGIGTPVVSNVETLTVSLAPVAPTIAVQPQNQAVVAGGVALFITNATGNPSTFTYVWKKGATTISDGTLGSGAVISGATTFGLRISGVTATEAGSYTMTVSNGVGSPATSTAAVLTVNPALSTTVAVATKVSTVGRAVAAFIPVTAAGGTVVQTVGGGYSFSVTPTLPAGLSLDAASGAISGTPTIAAPSANYTVTVADIASATSSKQFNLTVNPAVAATQSVATTVMTASQLATPFTPVTANGGTGSLTYAVSPALPAGLTFSASTGAITGTPTGASAATYTVTVTDTLGSSDSKTFTLNVNGPVTANQAVASQGLTVGRPAAFTPVTAAGGTAVTPYAFTIAPALTNGLSLNAANGQITGTPSAPATAVSYTVTVTDNLGAHAAASFNVIVNAVPTSTLVIPSKGLTAGTPITTAFIPVTASGGTAPLAFSVPSLPDGLTLSSSNGAITGKPTTATLSASYTITVTDAAGATTSQTLTLVVNPALGATQSVASNTLTVGVSPVSYVPVTVTVGTGTPNFGFTISPALSAGLTLKASTGAITGAPTAAAASQSYTVTITDGAGAVATRTFTLLVNGVVSAARAILSTVLTANQPAASFTPVTGAGGTAPLHYVVSPALPTGLTMAFATGAITGTPTGALLQTTFTVTVVDDLLATATQTFNLTINGPLTAVQSIPAKALTATKSVVGFSPVTGAGGTSPYTYTIAPALPTGLTMSTAGVITGTPAAAFAAAPFTITVTDTALATANNTFSLTVNPALATQQVIATRTLTRGTAAVPFIPVTASDGTPPYAFAIAPVLPATLLLDTTNGSISGTANTTLTATSFTITATDSVGATSNKTFSLTVNGSLTAGLVISTKTLTAGTAAVAFTPLPVTGGTPPYAYSVSPALPTGLVLDANLGSIGGTAAAGAASAVYTITATDSVGATVTQPLTLLVNPAPVATAAIPSKALLVNVAATAFTPVTVTAGTGTAPFVFTISPALPAGLSIAASTGAITGTPTAVSNVITYTVTATDSLTAAANATFTLKINRAPAITTQPTVLASYLVGGPLTLTVVANGSPDPTYVWRKGGTAIAGNTSATTATLTIPAVQLTDAGVYDVVVTNEVSSVTSNPVTAVVYLKPEITTQPANQTISAGGTATFTVVATADPAPTYQWKRNNVALAGATSPTLTLTNVPLNPVAAITVVVTNPGGFATSDPVTLTVSPIAPVFAAGLPTTATAVKDRNFFFPVSINNTTAKFTVTATDLSGPGGTLAVNEDNGSLSGAPANVGGPFPIAITATNATGNATFTLNLTVLAPPPVITSAASASGRVGTAFNFTVAGTNSPNSFTVTSGGLPPGLLLNTGTGAITGTPTAAGAYTAGITVANTAGSVSQPLFFNIDPSLVAPTFTGGTNLSGVQGSVFTFTPAFGGSPFTPPFTASGLPAGITLTNTANGTISGQPTVTGTFTVVITATNAGGSTAATFTLTINPAPTAPSITSLATANGRVGTAFTFALTASGTAPITYSATGLPAGLSINTATGAITGTPTAFGSFDVVIRATNAVGSGPSSVLSINIAPSATAPVITSPPVAPGQVGNPAFSYTLTGTNTPTSFQITSGTLPLGLSLNGATGAVTGTPSPAALGETRVWFNGKNLSGPGSTEVSGLSLEVLFVIAPPASTPVVNSNGTRTAQVGQPFQYTITASSTTAITGYGASGRPAWLALDSATGILSGVPTEATTTPISIALTASNGSGAGNPKTLLLTVAPAPATPVITSPLAASGRVGVNTFSYLISASESPTSFVASGLPPGLSLNVVTAPGSVVNTITGTPTVAGSFEVALRGANVGGLGAPSTLTIGIAPAVAAPAIQSPATANAQVGVAFTPYQIAVRTTDTPILSYGLTGTLPLGLALNTSTGVISGTPSDDPRLYTVQLTATNAGGTSLPQPLSINLAAAVGVPVLTTPINTSGTVGADFSFTITATNLGTGTGSNPVTYAPPVSLDAVNLPPGLAVNPATGVIQGKPTASGNTLATLTATNAAGSGPTRDLSITIQPALGVPVVAAGTAVGQVKRPFSFMISASNASPINTTYEVLDAPVWMTLNGATGAITGTPTVPGSFAVRLVATNGTGSSNPAILSVTILPAPGTPVLTSGHTATGTVGTVFTLPLAVTPVTPDPVAVPPIVVPTFTTFVATGLPGGLSINPSTGTISGTPTRSSPASNPFIVTVTATNDNGIGAPVVIVITILPNATFGN